MKGLPWLQGLRGADLAVGVAFTPLILIVQPFRLVARVVTSIQEWWWNR